jgi:hypothetical protein
VAHQTTAASASGETLEPDPRFRGAVTSRRERDRYEVAGAAMRATIERAVERADRKGLTRASRVLLAVLYLTGTYSRVSDGRVYVAQIANVAGIAGDVDERHTRRALAYWADLGVIFWEPAKGAGRASWVSLVRGPEQRPLMAPLAGGKTRPSVAGFPGEKPGHLESRNPAVDGPPTEKDREENVVERAGAREAATGDDDAEFAGLLMGLSPSSWQHNRWRAAQRESEAGFAWCVRQAIERGETPEAYLDELVRKGEHRTRATGQPSLPRPLADHTGCREVRGSHGSGYVRSPLGTDRPPPDWPHPKPTREEIMAALEELGSTAEPTREGAARPFDECMRCGRRAELVETQGRLVCETCAPAEEAA